MTKFKPQNKVQDLAYQTRGITSSPGFEKAIGMEPWSVARTTARHWWENGIRMPKPENLLKLCSFFNVDLGELIGR